MMNSLHIFPNFQSQPVSFGLCCIIWCGFVYFLLKRLQSKRNIKLAIQLIHEIEHSDIIDQLSKVVRQERKNTDKSRADIEEQFKVYIVKTIEQRAKTGLVTSALKRRNAPVGFTAISEHLRNILMSGLFASRLEAEALIKHTELKLFNESIRLKNILSSFLVIGLLGTLMGMSDSLGKFSDEAINVTKLVSQDLPSAFVPSIWGVISTIVGMLLYSRLVHTYYTPLKTNLEHATLNSWIPQLCPAISDIIVDKLEDNARRIEKQFADAATVAEFARDVQKELAPFRESIRNADQALKRVEPIINESEAAVALLNNYADKLTRSSENFSSTLDKFSFLEERLAIGYDALTAANETHSRQLSIWSSQFQALVEKNNAQVVKIDTQINNIFEALMDFDEQYLEVSKSQTEAVTELVKSVTAVKGSETALNRAIAERILEESSKKFTQLIGGVQDLTASLALNMAAVEKSLGEVDGTLKFSLDKMSIRVVNSLTGIRQELLGGLKGVQAELAALAGGSGTPPAKHDNLNDATLRPYSGDRASTASRAELFADKG